MFKDVKPVEYKYVFVKKYNKNYKITRYKARLVTQDFLQRLQIDLDNTYSFVINTIIF